MKLRGRPANPNPPSYGHRTIYVKDHDLWAESMKLANEMGISMSEYINIALTRMLQPEDENEVILNKIRALVR